MDLAILILAFNIKHFLADYLLQGTYMLGKFKKFPDFIAPLALHSGVHAFFTFCISIVFTASIRKDLGASISISLLLSVFDFIAHFTMDRIKADPELLGRFEALSKREFVDLNEIKSRHLLKSIEYRLKSNRYFWMALGFDQLIHHTTDLIICLMLICS